MKDYKSNPYFDLEDTIEEYVRLLRKLERNPKTNYRKIKKLNELIDLLSHLLECQYLFLYFGVWLSLEKEIKILKEKYPEVSFVNIRLQIGKNNHGHDAFLDYSIPNQKSKQ